MHQEGQWYQGKIQRYIPTVVAATSANGLTASQCQGGHVIKWEDGEVR